MAEVNRADGKYLETEFYIDSQWRFNVPALSRAFDSHDEMTTAIREAAKKLESSRRERLSIPCVTESGQRVTLKGLHATRGDFLTEPKIESGCGHKLWPECRLVEEAMKVKVAIERELQRIDDILDEMAIRKFDRWANRGNDKDFDHGKEVASARKKVADVLERSKNENIGQILQSTPLPVKRKIRL